MVHRSRAITTMRWDRLGPQTAAMTIASGRLGMTRK
jgi:hypothetical protein